MDADDFRRIALRLEGAEESSHMGKADFRVAGRTFATLALEEQGYGNLMLTPEQEAAFVAPIPACAQTTNNAGNRIAAPKLVNSEIAPTLLFAAARSCEIAGVQAATAT